MALFDRSRETYQPSPTTLRSTGNLTYLEFVRLVIRLWREAHPEIPIFPMSGDNAAKYPCIIYSLAQRQFHPSDPKPKPREVRYQGSEAEMIMGQRFQNVVHFSAITENDPILAEELIEVFEDFMMEYTGVFKELGLSDLMYSRRLEDDSFTRPGMGVSARTVAYLVTTEKIIKTKHARLNEVVVTARTWLEQDTFSNVPSDLGTVYDSSPRFYLTGNDLGLPFHVNQDDIDEASDPSQVVVRIPKTNFRIGDVVYLIPEYSEDGNYELKGFYVIGGIVTDQPYSLDMGYTLLDLVTDVATPAHIPVLITQPVSGKAYYIIEDIITDIVDQFATLPSE